MTKREAAIITAYTGYMLGSFEELQNYAEKLLDRSIWTHEFGNQVLADELREASKPDFMALEVK